MNQFIASTLDWKDEGFVLEQVTDFPREQGTTLKVKSSRPGERTIHVRIPGWVAGDPEVKINGRPVEVSADAGSYLAIRRTWKDGDSVSVSLPMDFRQERLPGDDATAAVLYGPLVLAADMGPSPSDESSRVIHSGDTSPKALPEPAALPKVADSSKGDWIRPVSKSELRFKATAQNATCDVIPMYQVRDQRYSVYWQKDTPKKA